MAEKYVFVVLSSTMYIKKLIDEIVHESVVMDLVRLLQGFQVLMLMFFLLQNFSVKCSIKS